MKKTILILAVLSSINSFSQKEKVKVAIGVFQNFGNIYANNSTYSPKKFNLNSSSLGASINVSQKNVDGWYPELKIDFSILPDTSTLTNHKELAPIEAFINETYSTKTINRSYDYNLALYSTSHQLIQFSMNRQVHKYFSIGSGVALDFRKTKFTDFKGTSVYDWNSSTNSYLFSVTNKVEFSNYTLKSTNFILPINFRFHLPVTEKTEFILANTLMLAINNHSYFQTLLMFKF